MFLRDVGPTALWNRSPTHPLRLIEPEGGPSNDLIRVEVGLNGGLGKCCILETYVRAKVEKSTLPEKADPARHLKGEAGADFDAE